MNEKQIIQDLQKQIDKKGLNYNRIANGIGVRCSTITRTFKFQTSPRLNLICKIYNYVNK